MQTSLLTGALLGLALGLHAASPAAEPNTLSDAEKQAGFALVFNGRDFEGWQQKGNWKIEDGAICRAERGGGLMYQAQPIPNDFELVFEWKVAQGSNSGVYYRPGQYEYQVLDNQAHNDGKNPRTMLPRCISAWRRAGMLRVPWGNGTWHGLSARARSSNTGSTARRSSTSTMPTLGTLPRSNCCGDEAPI